MRLPKSHCPRCNALQKFGLQEREVENDEIERFIRCGVCKWEQVVIRGDRDKIDTTIRIQKRRIRRKHG